MTSVEAMNYLTKRLNTGEKIVILFRHDEYMLMINDEVTYGSSFADAIERSIAEHGWKYVGD